MDSIAVDLRRRIVAGELAPGSRIATLDHLELEYAASRHTVQRAVRQLQQDGFLVSRGKAGTFVVDRPPHLCRYGLILPFRPDRQQTQWSLYHEALRRATERIAQDGEREFVIYYGIEGPCTIPEYRQLVYDVEHGRLAGLIFIIVPNAYRDTPVLSTPGLPRVSFSSIPVPAGVLRVEFDGDEFFRRALTRFHARGCRRLAFLCASGKRADWLNRLQQQQALMSEYGQETRDEWLQMVPHRSREWTPALVKLMFAAEAAERPDGLFIMDDNLVTPACRGLVDAGVRVPGELDVVAHTNFPWPAPAAVPVYRVGNDVQGIMRRCVELIDAQRAGRTPDAKTVVPVVERADEMISDRFNEQDLSNLMEDRK